MYPSDRKYTKDFLWLRVEGATASVGLTDYAVKMLSDVSAVTLPAIGRVLARGETFGSAEGLKSSTDLLAPVSGVVNATNTGLINEPARIQADPHGTWIVKLELTDPAEVAALLSSAQFEQHLRPASKPVRAPDTGRPSASASATPNPPPRVAASAPASPRVSIEPEKAIHLLWSERLRDSRLHGDNSAFGDSDYSGGSYFSWRERDIAFTSERKADGILDRRYQWRDTTHTRVSAAGLSNSTKSHTDYAGTWDIDVIGRVAYLVLQDRERGRLRLRLEEGLRGAILLDGRSYALQKR
jgi:glycine cleavage system H protein